MVNYSINIKKKTNHLSPKTNELKKDHYIGVGNPDPGLGQAQIYL
jgi:hypothetical protein